MLFPAPAPNHIPTKALRDVSKHQYTLHAIKLKSFIPKVPKAPAGHLNGRKPCRNSGGTSGSSTRPNGPTKQTVRTPPFPQWLQGLAYLSDTKNASPQDTSIVSRQRDWAATKSSQPVILAGWRTAFSCTSGGLEVDVARSDRNVFRRERSHPKPF